MLFSAGLGIGLLFYGVAEPIGNLNDYPEMLENNISHNAGKALSLTNLHWGLHGWAVYASLGLCFAFASYNKNKAFRVSSLLGESVESNKPLSCNNRYYCYFDYCYRYCYIPRPWCLANK